MNFSINPITSLIILVLPLFIIATLLADTEENQKQYQRENQRKYRYHLPFCTEDLRSEGEMMGFLGLALVVIGFGLLMIDTIRNQRCDIPRPILVIFIIAGCLLFWHALSLDDVVFMALNLVLIFVNAVNLYYA